jgi:hypothetical protein
MKWLVLGGFRNVPRFLNVHVSQMFGETYEWDVKGRAFDRETADRLAREHHGQVVPAC